MAKKAPTLPSIEQQVPEVEIEQEPESLSAEMRQAVGMIEVPMIDGVPSGYINRTIKLQGMSRRQSLALRAILLGLEAQDAKLANGRMVSRPAHALLWLLENVVS